MDPSAEGKRYPEVELVVSGDRVRAFHDLFGGPPGVPPTFPTVAEFAALPAIVDDPELGIDYARVVHASQEYEYRRPLRPGERLVARPRISSIRHKGGHGFLTLETELVDADGRSVAVSRSTMLERSGS